ncbi:uncharacterized protein LOC128333614 [Hemicordylus capensis]|uniref:uncharacterized protein LOC128333614 n=1 Tax=Hemicordylus capensis TaxID=884348 RepID=UPI002302DAF0|nr:uncharacterized protein LOC128333614 [Hemicordylus capensis]
MHCTLISSDESELEDLKLGEELMVDRSTQRVWEDLSDTERQSSRALGNQSGDSSVSSMHCSLFSSSSYQSEVEDYKVDEELIKIIHRHMEDREEVVMEKSPVQSGPTILLLYAMAAVSRLSKIKPPTDPELESAILRFAVRGVIEVQAGHVHKQALHKLAADNLELMLRGFLSEAPTTQHLLSLLENSAELPSFGHNVPKLGICIMDSRRDVSRYAREGIYRLLEVLLHHKGQSSKEAGELGSQRWQQDERILAYLNTARVGEVFREIFNKDQRRSFLRTTLWAIDHPLHRIEEAGQILLYSLLGKADALMGHEVTY